MELLLYIVMFLFLLNSFTTSQSLIHDSCKKAASTNPKLKYNICVQSLEQNPQSKTATSLDGLVIASTNTAVSKTKILQGNIDNILKAKKFVKETEMPLRDCLQLYTDAIDSLNEAIATVKSRNYKTAITVLSAAMTAPDTCETGFKERKTISPVANQNADLVQTIQIPLAFTNMLSK